MKTKFKWLLALIAMVASVNLMAGVTDLSESLDLTTKSVGQAAYNTTTTYGDWKIVNGANNNKGWTYFKMGGKSTTISKSNPCYIYYSAEGGVSSQVDSITVSIAAGSLSKDNMSVNSWGVYVYSDKDMKTQIDYVEGGTITKNAAEFGFKPTDGVTWAAGSYYKVSWDLANTTSTNGIVCVDKITLHSISAPAILDSLVIKGKATKMKYEVGEAFDPAGLEVWGIYTKIEKGDSTSQIKSGITWSIDPETFTEASDNASVTLSASYKDKTSSDTTITGIKVAPLPKYATIYTSNVEFTTEGGTKATLSKVVVAEGDTVKAIKCGTGSVDGSCVITIPAATKTLHFHVVGWSGKNVELDINGEKLAIAADAGITNNSPFTLTGTASDYYYAIDPKGATSITFKATKDYRFVLFGVNAELEEGAIAAPVFTPTDTDFDGSVEVTLTCETEGAAIYYTLDGSEPTAASTLYEAAFTLIDTTTVKAIAIKDGKSSAVAEKTYNLVPAYTLAELVAAGAPTKEGTKVVLVLDNEKITGIDGARGIYVKSGDQEVEIFCYNLPATAVEGAYVSGRAMGKWFLFGTEDPKKWELQPDNWDWATFAPTTPTSCVTSVEVVTDKVLRDGQLYILRNGVMYDVAGHVVK